MSLKKSWLSRKPHPFGAWLAGALGLGLLLFFLFGGEKLPASPEAVFQHHEYWRAWTALCAHADFGHFFSNAFLLLPLSYFLGSYFGLFPLLGFLLGGLVNLVVLRTLPTGALLLGVSGVVYWMGAATLTLSLLIDRRERLRRRIGSVVFLTLVLFVPETYNPEISYLSHFLGFLLGILSGFALYYARRKTFAAAEVWEANAPPLETLDWDLPPHSSE